jgi:hypothetical protein
VCVDAHRFTFRYELFKSRVNNLLRGQFAGYSDGVGFDEMFHGVNQGLAEQHAFSVAEADEALRLMSEQNKIMYSDGMCYSI